MRYIEILTIASVSLLLVLATYLIVKARPKNDAFRWIGVFLLLLALNFGDGQLLLSGFYYVHPQLAGWEEAFILLYGPTLLFFARSATDPPLRWSLRNWVHLLPFLVAELLMVGLYQSLPIKEQQAILNSAAMMSPPFSVVLAQLAALAHVLVYTLWARQILLRHEEQMMQQYSSRIVGWTKSVFRYLIGLFAMSFAATLILQAGNEKAYVVALMVIVASTGIFIFYALIQALEHPLLLATNRRAPEYSLAADEVEQISTKIRDYFENSHGYMNPDLTIADLAEQLAEPVREVSHVVNHHLASNFYDLVNGYRIKAAERMFSTEPASKATISEVMYRVGFNTKSSFNTQFKLKTGLTPSQYRNRYAAPADGSDK